MWDTVLPVLELAYTILSTGLSPFEIVIGYKPRKPIDLPFLQLIGLMPQTESFEQRLHHLHNDISRQIAVSNDNYKSVTDLHKRLQEFAVEDEVMIRVRPERFPLRTLKKLFARRIGPSR